MTHVKSLQVEGPTSLGVIHHGILERRCCHFSSFVGFSLI